MLVEACLADKLARLFCSRKLVLVDVVAGPATSRDRLVIGVPKVTVACCWSVTPPTTAVIVLVSHLEEARAPVATPAVSVTALG